MITSFRCKDTQDLFEGGSPRCFQAFRAVAERKLTQLHVAVTLGFLRSPPGNQLEKLSGDRAGQWSIRINRQWRLCFIWDDSEAREVEIVDYH